MKPIRKIALHKKKKRWVCRAMIAAAPRITDPEFLIRKP